MAKNKKEPNFKEWKQVGEALKQISIIERTLKSKEIQMNADIDGIKNAVQKEITPLIEERDRLAKEVKEFTEYNIDEFKDRKTREFPFGTVGFRKSTNIITRNVKAILEALKNNKMLDCINVKESINKDELSKYDDTSLAKIGAKRKVTDNFFYNIDEERVDK